MTEMAQTNATAAVCHVSITQGQTQSSSFRARAVSAVTARGLNPLMQSKHVINGPSQPPLFVVRQTLKSNVSTMAAGENLLARQKVLMRGVFSHAEISFTTLPLSFQPAAHAFSLNCPPTHSHHPPPQHLSAP